MDSDERKREILSWQQRLEDRFSHNGIVGGLYLAPLLELERQSGRHFITKYHGHRLLIDSFFEFFGRTLQSAQQTVTKYGWPTNRPHYVDCLLRFLTLFRTARAAELLSTSGYPMEGYALQRSLREHVFALAAVANKLTSLESMRGYDGASDQPWSADDQKKIIKAQKKAERDTRYDLLEKGLSPPTIEALRLWDRLFHRQVHGAQLTYFVELNRLLQPPHEFAVGPVPTEESEAMYMNRSHEIGWMVVRVLPFLQLREAPFIEQWEVDWHLLDDSFRFIARSLEAMGKPIAAAFAEFLDTKFRFDPSLRYFE